MKKNKLFLTITALFAFIATMGVAHGSNTLWDYYQSRGEALPSVAQRRIIAMDLGMRNYAPTAIQNTELLNRLQGGDGSFGSALPNIPADFETSLADRISASDTSMTLVKGTDRYGTALSGLYGFVIDQGESTQEYVTATCTATACTGLTRGLSYTDPNVGSSARAYIHRRGASVKISDYPQITLMTRMFKGTDGIPNGPMYYDTSHSFGAASSTVIVTKQYVDDTAFVGSPDASAVQKGIIQIPTTTQVASSTSTGSTGARLVIPASMASSSPAIADHIAVITKNTGKIDKGFIDGAESYTWSGNNTFSGANTFATTTAVTSTVTSLTATNATTTSLYINNNKVTGINFNKSFVAGEAISARDVVKIKWTAVNAGAYASATNVSANGWFNANTGTNILTDNGSNSLIAGYDSTYIYAVYFKPSTPIRGTSFKISWYKTGGGGAATTNLTIRALNSAWAVGSPPPSEHSTVATITVTTGSSGNDTTYEYTVSGLTYDQVERINAYGFKLGFVSGANYVTFNSLAAASNKPQDTVYIGTDFTEKVYKAGSSDVVLGNVVGLAESAISSDATGSVITSGIVSGFTGLVPGMRYVLSTAGAITPDATNSLTTIGSYSGLIGVAVSDTELLLKIN